MAKRTDACMFCEQNPCACSKPARPSRPIKTVNLPAPVLATEAQMPAPRVREPMTTDRACTVVAIQNLREMLSPESLLEYMTELNLELTTAERASVWRSQTSATSS